MDNQDHLNEIAAAVTGPLGIEVFNVTVKPYRGTANIELLVDLPGGGISLDQCARINHDIRQMLEDNGLYGGDYTLSVSSPGLDWPLKSPRDFRRVIGRTLEIVCRISEESEDTLRVIGTLIGVNEQGICLNTAEGEGNFIFGDILKAVITI